jgi:hypothetical protein
MSFCRQEQLYRVQSLPSTGLPTPKAAQLSLHTGLIARAQVESPNTFLLRGCCMQMWSHDFLLIAPENVVGAGHRLAIKCGKHRVCGFVAGELKETVTQAYLRRLVSHNLYAHKISCPFTHMQKESICSTAAISRVWHYRHYRQYQ